jgi:small subunit ribosomal protein S4
MVCIKEKSRDGEKIKALLEGGAARPVPAWLERGGPEGKILALPERDQIFVPVEEHLIVEFYSK